jgi:hypothetical protein
MRLHQAKGICALAARGADEDDALGFSLEAAQRLITDALGELEQLKEIQARV